MIWSWPGCWTARSGPRTRAAGRQVRAVPPRAGRGGGSETSGRRGPPSRSGQERRRPASAGSRARAYPWRHAGGIRRQRRRVRSGGRAPLSGTAASGPDDRRGPRPPDTVAHERTGRRRGRRSGAGGRLRGCRRPALGRRRHPLFRRRPGLFDAGRPARRLCRRRARPGPRRRGRPGSGRGRLGRAAHRGPASGDAADDGSGPPSYRPLSDL
uniref:LigA n=1 Tax=Parastrongyloides trichosuri TaxID=131310 RepID=A0A0N4ZZN4_PARTI